MKKIVAKTTKYFYCGRNTLWIFSWKVDNIDIDLGGLMKLFNQFNVLPKYLTAFNYSGLKLKNIPKELEKCTPEFKNFWDKECREHPINQNCLIYCDWVTNFLVFIK